MRTIDHEQSFNAESRETASGCRPSVRSGFDTASCGVANKVLGVATVAGKRVSVQRTRVLSSTSDKEKHLQSEVLLNGGGVSLALMLLIVPKPSFPSRWTKRLNPQRLGAVHSAFHLDLFNLHLRFPFLALALNERLA